ncbi:MAG: epoxyqueuosine reductase QueH [Dehalococcoidia bacterium]|nr:epoxyqueuosine reductase QueH [Dehalococcoidia bacterium]
MKIVLHICCGVCAAGAADVLLNEGHQVTGYFYNPNIYPEEEYHLRLEAAQRVADTLKFELVAGPYDIENWNAATAGMGNEPEGGARCSICYRRRLAKTFDFMRETGADIFTSTLTISPHKQAAEINRIGKEIGGDRYMARDFKKKDGFKRSMEMAKSWELYRQNYCGCIYSLRGPQR